MAKKNVSAYVTKDGKKVSGYTAEYDSSANPGQNPNFLATPGTLPKESRFLKDYIADGKSIEAARKKFLEKQKEVIRKAPPTLKRGTPEWENFEKNVLHTDRLPAGPTLAYVIAFYVHEGQTDQIGEKYIEHPMGVWELMKERPEFAQLTDEEKNIAEQAAFLHDTLEDTALTADDLRSAGFDERVIQTVDAVTAREGEPKPDYYERVKAAGPMAVCVKLGDLSHNNLPERRENLPGSPSNPVAPEDVGNPDVDRWTKLGRKYYLAYQAFDAEVPEHLKQFAPA